MFPAGSPEDKGEEMPTQGAFGPGCKRRQSQGWLPEGVPASEAPLIISGMGAVQPGFLWGAGWQDWQREGASSEPVEDRHPHNMPMLILNLTHVPHSPSHFLPLPSGLNPTTCLQRGGLGSEMLISLLALKSTAEKIQDDCSHHPIIHRCPSLPR